MHHKTLKECMQILEPKLSSMSVVVLSIGSRVSARNGYSNNDQMQPPFADEIALKGYDVHVINIDPHYSESLNGLLSGPKLQHAATHYISEPLSFDQNAQTAGAPRKSGDTTEQENVINKLFANDAKIIVIDNTCKSMMDFTIDFARHHASKIHNHLEIVHRYIGINGGVALHYNKNVFVGDTTNTIQKIAHAMQLASSCDNYDQNAIDAADRVKNQKKQREYWIAHQAEYQARIGNTATFYPVGLRSVDPEQLFKHDFTYQLRTKTIHKKVPRKRSQFFKNTPLEPFYQLHIAAKIALVALMILTLPVSLIVIGIALLVNYVKNQTNVTSQPASIASKM